jgi:NTE family protein
MPAQRRWALVVCGGAVFVTYLDVTIVNVALPTIAHDLGSSLRTSSWVITAYNVAYTALLVTAGRFADSHGRRRVFGAGLLAFGTASALCACAWDVGSLVLFRIAQGAAGAVLVPVSLALLLPAWPHARRSFAIGAWGSLGAIAAALGPPLGGLLSERASWRLIFLVNVPVALGLVYASRRVLAESPRERERPLDRAGVALVAGAVAAVTLAVVQLPVWGPSSPRTLALLAVGGCAALALAGVERRAAAPVLDPVLFRVRSFTVGTLASALFFAAFLGYALNGVLVVQGAWGYSPLRAGLAYAPGPLLAALLTPFGGGLADRFGERRVGAIGLAAFALDLAGFALLLGPTPDYAGRYLPLVLVGGASLALVFPALTGVATAEVPGATFATATGVLSTVRQIGGVLGVAVVVAIVGGLPQTVGGYRAAYAVLATSAAAALVALAALPRRAPADATPAPTPRP